MGEGPLNIVTLNLKIQLILQIRKKVFMPGQSQLRKKPQQNIHQRSKSRRRSRLRYLNLQQLFLNLLLKTPVNHHLLAVTQVLHLPQIPALLALQLPPQILLQYLLADQSSTFMRDLFSQLVALVKATNRARIY